MKEPANQNRKHPCYIWGMLGQRSPMDFFASGFLQTSDTGAHGSSTLSLLLERHVFSPLLKRGEFQQEDSACGVEMGASVNRGEKIPGTLRREGGWGKWLELSESYRSGMRTEDQDPQGSRVCGQRAARDAGQDKQGRRVVLGLKFAERAAKDQLFCGPAGVLGSAGKLPPHWEQVPSVYTQDKPSD